MRGRAAMLVVTVVTAAGVIGCASDGRELRPPGATVATTPLGSNPATIATLTPAPPSTVAPQPSATSDPTADEQSVTPEGFEAVAATITDRTGAVCDVCLWRAATPDQRSRGLMHVTDLGVGDGMLFHYDIPTSTSFWMKDTVMPLSIAFFDAAGAFVDQFDMEPCTVEPCERYPTPIDFVDAIEFARGTATDFGVGDGSTLVVTGLPCESDADTDG